jgi:hypothetical protein
VRLSHLPETVLEMVELIGMPAALKIVESYGGVRLYVPQTIVPDHPLEQLIGRTNAEKLAARYGGEHHFDIPRCVEAARHARDDAIAAEFLAGASYRTLAQRYRLTERSIGNILTRKRITEDDRQTSLF